MKNILKNYRRRLLNLGSGNKSLLLLRLSKEMHLDVSTLDFLGGEAAFEIINKLLSGRKKISLSPFVDSRHAPVYAISRRLKLIKRKAEMVFEERGSKELYMGWPFVQGSFSEGTPVRCPLLFFPIKLEVSIDQEWVMVPDLSQPAHFNQSFLLAYAHYTGTPLAEELTELDLSTLSNHPLEFRTQLYELLKEHLKALNPGRDIFEDKLITFRDYKKAAFDETVNPSQFRLVQEAVIGLFPQADSYLLNDYDELLSFERKLSIEDLFPERMEITTASPQHTFTAFAIDASQEAALQAVKQGRSLVVQGPPGTGKSQLICNLISDFTARGKKVLVVSQKRAALDVVHQRLSSQGMGSFATLVHDINADRKSVFKQLQIQIEQIDAYKRQNLSLNSIYTDRLFLEKSRRINSIAEKLQKFKFALYDTGKCGWSAKELYLKCSLTEPYLKLPESYKEFNAISLSESLPRMQKYLEQALDFSDENFVWRDRKSMRGYTWEERKAIERTIQELPSDFSNLAEQFSQVSGYTLTIDKLEACITAKDIVAEVNAKLKEEEVANVLQKLVRQQVKQKELKELLQQLKQLYLVCPAPDEAVPERVLPELYEAIKAYEQQKDNVLLKVKWAFSAKKKILKEALAKYNLPLNEASVGKLQHRLELRRSAQFLIQQLNTLTAVSFSLSDLPTQVLHKVKSLEQASEMYQLLNKLSQLKVFHTNRWQENKLPDLLQQLYKAITTLEGIYKQWLQWLTVGQIEKIVKEQVYREKLLEDLPVYFERLVSFDTLKASIPSHELEMIDALLRHGFESASAGINLFQNSLYLSWLQEIEKEYPELRMPSNGELEQLEQELQKLLKEKQQLSQEIVLSGLREQTYKHLEMNRLGNVVTYRRLHAQVIKKRSLYPIRKLFSLFSDEIFDLVPCWLASPETVSAVFPLQSCFDLVIFDEASQCFSERGIPAMRRGKQVVVAGDQHQLNPSDLYRTRWVGEEEAEELSAESLLQLCSLYLPQVMLTQHYRSRYPELIEFSNKLFYNHKLELIPELQDLNEKQPAIKFVKVHGLWHNNTNQPEAEKVVEVVLELLGSGKEDIGVITFNYNQQMLVQDLLEMKAQEQKVELPQTLLVKNIENIQGDEKEIIVMSVGYAPDSAGVLRMQFGSLNQAGGENRLNVAVTRAKEQVVVVSSIRAEQLKVDEASHAGPKLLKEYLHYAQQVSRRCFKYEPKQANLPTQIPLLKEHLQQLIPALHSEVPFADLTLKLEESYKGVVLTDDDLYYSQSSLRYIHSDLPVLLSDRHWLYAKVYSRQFWENPEYTKRLIINQFNAVELC